MFGSCCRAAARPACPAALACRAAASEAQWFRHRSRQVVHPGQTGHKHDWPAAAGAASTADTAGPFSVGAAAAAAGALASAVRRRAASSSHRRRCLGARGASRQHASRGRLPLRSSKAAVYEDSSCLARKVAMVSDISGWQALDRPTGKLAVCIVCCRIRCIENCCIRPKIAV